MNNLCADIGYRSVNHYGEELCGDHVDVDVGTEEGLEHLAGTAGVVGHTCAHDGDLGHLIGGLDGIKADQLLILLQGLHSLGHVILADGEADVLGIAAADGLENNIYIDALLC